MYSALTFLSSVSSVMILKPLFILVAGYICACRLGTFSSTYKHYLLWICLVSVVISLCLTVLLPEIYLPLISPDFLNSNIFISINAYLESIDYQWFIFGAYLFGVVWVLFYFLVGIFQLKRQLDISEKCKCSKVLRVIDFYKNRYNFNKKINVVLTSTIRSPQVWGWIHPVLMLPANFNRWSDRRLKHYIAHELAHIVRDDWVMMMATNVCCALFWFLMPVWWVRKKILEYAEYACDDLVLHTGILSVDYAEDLLIIAANKSGKDDSGLVFSAEGVSSVYLRVQSVLQSQRDRVPLSKKDKLMVFIIAIVLIAPFSVMRATYYSHNNEIVFSNGDLIDVDLDIKQSQKNHTGIELSDSINWRDLKSKILSIAEPKERLDLETLNITIQPPFYDEDNVSLDHKKSVNINIDVPMFYPQISRSGYNPEKYIIPKYPASALRKGLEGRVVIEFSISKTGGVINPKVVDVEGGDIFVGPSLAAINRFQYPVHRSLGRSTVVHHVREVFSYEIIDSTSRRRRR